jgi:hypothetical protein
MKAIAPALAVFAALFAFGSPAAAATTTEQAVQADLNGDGRLDRVVAKPVAGSQNEQLLVATVNGVSYVAREPMDPDWGVQPLRVVDVNADGRYEILLPETVGMRTDSFSVWGLNNGWRPVVFSDQTRLLLWEGGEFGDTISGYGCEFVGRRQVVTVFAELTDPTTGRYDGERSTYNVQNGIAEQTSRLPVRGTRDYVASTADPQACA